MLLHYLETSALAKRYMTEIGSAWVRAFTSSEAVSISRLSVTELAATLTRRTNEGGLTAEERADIFTEFLADARSFLITELSEGVAHAAAARLLGAPSSIRLRALDALHLACAGAAFVEGHTNGATPGSFVSADRRLLDAARWLGLTTLNPEDYP